MRKFAATLLFAVAPLAIVSVFPVATLAATMSELGDLSSLSAIATDTLNIAKSGDLKAAEHRITDFESAWDKAAGTMQPLSPEKWHAVDMAADDAISSLRTSAPDAATVEAAVGTLIAELDNPGGSAMPAATTPAANPGVFAVTNADGSPLPCEVALKSLRDAEPGKVASDQAKYDEAKNKGIDRCNADDDKRADGLFAQAYALLQ
jgi:hypothetical protein